MYCLLMTIAGTGIRISELRFITVKAVQKGRAEIRLKGKTRTILLTKELRSRLLKYISHCGISNGCVFRTRSGRPLDRSNVCHDMKKLCRDAAVDPNKSFRIICGICSHGYFMRWKRIWRISPMCWGTAASRRQGSMWRQAQENMRKLCAGCGLLYKNHRIRILWFLCRM